MLAAYAASQSASDPLSGLVIGERPDPEPRPGWSVVTLKAAGLNHHDVWSLKGVGLPADRLPMVLGCDGAGLDEDGNEVIVHAVVASEGWHGDETLDPRRTLLSELHDGTLAEKVLVPTANLVPKPAGLGWHTAACLSTAWLTAYRMLFSSAGLTPGATVLVQGAGGGVATALVQLGAATGYRVWATSRDEAKRAKALEIGADAVFEPGARLPERVDAVMETVGAATWSHSINSLRPGGTVVISGATSGDAPARAELTKIYFKQLRVIGSTMGNRQELERLARLVG
ncbi:MAG: zinc-binding dehydrogenase, partial [Oryzihumus sp.]